LNDDTTLETTERQLRNFRGVLLFACTVILIVVILWNPMTLPFMEVTTADIVTLLMSLGLIASIIERAVEVILAVTRAKDKRVLRTQAVIARNSRQEILEEYKNLTAKARTMQETGDQGQQMRDAKAELALMTTQVKKNAKDLAIYTGNTKILSMIYAFTMGIIASALGIRVLEPLVDPIVFKQLQGFHKSIFYGFDVLITGALLGGGSNGIHKILDMFLSWSDKVRGGFKGDQ
jgi:hypothetical protein